MITLIVIAVVFAVIVFKLVTGLFSDVTGDE